ncbi:complex I NDUFA9 subunit family protein [Thiococcus pfennigii]|uniref:complex I NDUFA9 subunit family protein n=1 Tax=Thiococcus pfennigii TaxID=1057 RepID=UPI0019072DF8|nr:complex I NDUFA9 subunit family protein [Thiococcus pfennigii]MBK1702071.1 epimerase [Thiococcus pfennigii]
MKETPICLIGATGFVGRHLIHRLARDGHPCRLLVRRPERHRDLRLIPGLDVRGVDPFDPDALAGHLAGCGTLVNLVGILNETGPDTFERVHVELVARLIAAAQAAGVGRFLQMSALNADATGGASRYLRSKGAGEDLAHAEGGRTMAVTSFQPSVIFGRGDHFFNRFASLLRVSPGLFPLACPQARFAPLYVGDLVAAMAGALDDPATHGRRYPLCGPRAFTLQELVEYTAATIGRRTRVIGLDERLSRFQAQLFEHLPGKPFTLDNYLSMQTPSVCAEDGLAALGVRATDITAVVPEYLAWRRT